MKRGRPHHLENAVIALAVLLALVLVYFGVEKMSRGRRSAAALAGEPAPPAAGANTLMGSGTESAVSALPPFKLSGIGGGRTSKSAPPPAPGSSR